MRLPIALWIEGNKKSMPKKLALLALIAFIVGIGLGSLYLIPLPFLVFILLLSAGFLCAWFFGRRNAYLLPALFLLCLALGAGRAVLAPHTMPEAFAALLGTKIERTGMVVADPDVRESTERILVQITEGASHMRTLVVTERFPSFEYGDVVSVSGLLTRPEPFDTDGSRTFAYDKFLAKDGVFAIIPHASIEKVGESNAFLVRVRRLLYEAKHGFARALENTLTEPQASLAEGLITGGKQGLGKTLLDAFTITGLLPIVVLSGYNVMIIADAILLSLAALPRPYRIALATLAIFLFVLAAGTGASAVRAGIMAGIALFAKATHRTYDALRALAFVFVLMLLVNPLLLLYDPGFQFSFAATLGLVVASSLFEIRLLWLRPRLMREVLATTLAAQLFVLPLLLYQTGNLSLVAVPANLLVLPIVPLAMAASAFAGGIALIVPPLAVFVGLPAYALLSYIIGVAQVGASLPFAHIIIPAFPALLLIPAYVLVALLVSRLRSTPQSKISPRYSSISR